MTDHPDDPPRIVAYARFSVDDRSSTFFNDTVNTFTVSFDSLNVVAESGPCHYIPQTLATAQSTSTITGPTGSDILSQFVRYGRLRIDHEPMFTIRPNPATGGDIEITASTNGDHPYLPSSRSTICSAPNACG
jgi:hypothetical protein